MKDTWWVDPEELDDYQKGVITLPLDKSCLVTGPPGSGKSNLLILRANYLASGGRGNVAVIVFTNALQRFLASGASQYSFDSDRITTSIAWSMRFLGTLRIAPKKHDSFIDTRRALLQQVKEAIKEKKVGVPFDTILLDEAQDYWPDEIDVFRRLCKYLFVVGDGKQKIYDGENGITKATEYVDEVRELKFHYRNGRKICAVADEIGQGIEDFLPLSPDCNYKEKDFPSEATIVKCDNDDEQYGLLLERLSTQLKAYPDSNIGVLCPLRKDLEKLWAAVQDSPLAKHFVVQFDDDGLVLGDESRVSFSTIHSAKGLEFRAVHMPYSEGLKKYPVDTRRISYVAVTRAKTSFTAYHCKPTEGYFDEAIRSQEGRLAEPTLESAFGRKK